MGGEVIKASQDQPPKIALSRRVPYHTSYNTQPSPGAVMEIFPPKAQLASMFLPLKKLGLLWARHLTTLSPSFFIYKMGIVPAFYPVVRTKKCESDS